VAKGAKIGEGRVEITADTSKLPAALADAKSKIEGFLKNQSEDAAAALAKSLAAIPIAIFAARRAFDLGVSGSNFYRDLMDANILVQDLRRELSKPGDELFSKAQGDKASLTLDRLKRQLLEVGDAAGAIDKIVGQELTSVTRKIAEEQRKAAEEVIKGAQSQREDYGEILKKILIKDKELTAKGQTVGISGLYDAVMKDIADAEAAGINTVNSAAQERIKLLKEELALKEAIMRNDEAMALFQRQEQQRSGFGLGQVALDPTVLSRELTRAFQNGGRY